MINTEQIETSLSATTGAQQVMVSIPMDVLRTLVTLSNRYIEDIDTGIEEGIYVLYENPDLEEYRQKVDIAESLYEAANPRTQKTTNFDNTQG